MKIRTLACSFVLVGLFVGCALDVSGAGGRSESGSAPDSQPPLAGDTASGASGDGGGAASPSVGGGSAASGPSSASASDGGSNGDAAGPATPSDAGVSVPKGVCAEPVPPTTTGPTVDLPTIRVNWSMACYKPEDGSLFVFVEDTANDMVALRFYDFLNDGGPAAGDTVDLSARRAEAKPFFVSTISGIETSPQWTYAHDYLAYEGSAQFSKLARSNPVGTQLEVRFRNVRAREIVNTTSGVCQEVPNGARMLVRDLTINLTIQNLHTDSDCVTWAGG